MCKYCTLRHYVTGPIRSMKTWRGATYSMNYWRGGIKTTARIEWRPEHSRVNFSPFVLMAGTGESAVAVGITHCPWCGKELKPPKPPEGGCIATSLATGDVFMPIFDDIKREINQQFGKEILELGC